MYKQVLDPVSHSLGWTSIFAVLPLVALFVMLGLVRMKAQWPSLLALLVAIGVAIAVYSMPIGQAGDAALEGAAFGFWPIMWIVINALWIFDMTEATGSFAVLRRVFASLSDDARVQVVVIAFCFGALLEALAGFGTPVAICGIMLVGLGLKPVKAAAVALVADTAPVAFGAIRGWSGERPGFERRVHANDGPPPTRAAIIKAFAPYAIIVVVLGVSSLNSIQTELDKLTSAFSWPGLNVLNSKGNVPTSETFKLN